MTRQFEETAPEADTSEESSFFAIEHDAKVLIKKIEFLEEELVRKDAAIEKLRQENELLFRSMIKSKDNQDI